MNNDFGRSSSVGSVSEPDTESPPLPSLASALEPALEEAEELRPPFFPLRTPLAQGFLVTQPLVNEEKFASHAGAFLIDAGPDESDLPLAQGEQEDISKRHVRLLAYYTPACTPVQDMEGRTSVAPVAAGMDREYNYPKGLVILLHGWEGSSHAMFNRALGGTLTRAGYDVVRLNLRDHGPVTWLDPVTLNEGLFMATLLNEVKRAVDRIASMARGGPVFFVGPSMGGNFALRLATRFAAEPLPNVQHMIAINPLLDPGGAIDRLDNMYIFRHFFRRRWLRSLQRKAAAFPHRYDFTGLERINLLRPMTEWVIRRYTHFDSADAYFSSYSFLGEDSRRLAIPTTLITSVDDPVISVQDIESLADTPQLTRRILSWGGHLGLVTWPPLRHRFPQIVLEILSTAV